MSRAETLEFLRSEPEISVLIIGGGINGIGTFRDLAVQGVDVLLVEKGDYGSGASAASSHMLHGGIRYLENGEFRLVREALTERNLMLQNAPHYAKPLPTTIPIFKWFSGFLNAPLKFLNLRDKPGERGAVVIKLGLILYDIFARNYRVMPTHRVNGREKSLQLYPNINPDIVCTANYYDAWMPSPERICLEQVLDAETLNPQARALNYCAAVAGQGDSVTLKDEITGERYTVKPRVVINAAGPWIDFANNALGQQTHMIGGTKGSHIIVDNPELHRATNGNEIFFENNDGRIVLIMPFMGKVMIGTTDIRIDDPEQAICTDDEIDYMVNLVGKVFPAIKVERSQIIFKFCGVRPLPGSDKNYTGNISRDHSIQTLEPQASGLKYPVYALVGGKWTTFRAFAEQTADRVLEFLKLPRKASTMNMAIGGGLNYPKTDEAKQSWAASVAEETKLSVERVQTLLERYGTRAEQIAGFIMQGVDSPLKTVPDYSTREIAFIAEQERVLHLEDVVLRRTLLAWLGQVSTETLIEIADILASSLGWSAERKQQEIDRAIQVLQTKHGLELAVPVV